MSFDLDAALEALARRIDRVESDRVARMAELERGLNAKLEHLNERMNHDAAKFNAALERIEALEREFRGHRHDFTAELQTPIANAETERRADWMRTRDAALTGLLAKSAGEGVHNAEFIRAATVFADCAHGPLEIVVPAGTTFDADALAKGGKLVSGPGWSQWDAKVEALVKAAREIGKMLTDFMSQEMYGELMESMEREDYDALNEARVRVLTKCEHFEERGE